MNPYTPPPSRIDCPHLLTICQGKALRLLSEAWLAARSEGQDVWQFAVEIDQLRALGLSHTDLRCLLCWGYLEHARERTTAGSSQRFFEHLSTLALPKRTCFVLTGKGQEITSAIAAETLSATLISVEKQGEYLSCSGEAPHWDGQERQLWWQDYLIKQFRVPAPNQETVLAALEEDNWPAQMDDPLPCKPGMDAKIRLHDTIKALNRHHLHRLLRFCGDGSGLGVRWFFVNDG